MLYSRVTSKGQTTIPEKIRKALRIKPRTCLIDRFGRPVWSFLPRPVVSPITTQLAAR